MFRFLKFLALAFLSLTVVAQAASVSIRAEDAREWANNKGQALLTTLSEADPMVKYSKLDQMLTEDVNLDYISKFVIGKYAKQMTAAQKQRYSNLFQRYMLSLYKQFNLDFDANALGFAIEKVEEHEKFTTVSCLINPGNKKQTTDDIEIQKLPVKFKLIRGVNNHIQAVDMEIAKISMVLEYRKRFYQMIRDEDEDIEWFLDKFDAQVKANEKAFQKNAEL